MVKVYLDDLRTPTDIDWTVIRNFEGFKTFIKNVGIDNIKSISFDHDLADFDSDGNEYTGMCAAKWLIDHYYDFHEGRFYLKLEDKLEDPLHFPETYVHSANPVGAENIISYVNQFLKFEGYSNFKCQQIEINHTV